MQINIAFKPNLSKLGKAMSSVDITGFLKTEINKFAALTERYGNQLTPVDTGRLRASFHFSPANLTFLTAVVNTNTDYDVFVHEGTRFMRARPFLAQGVKFAQRSYDEQDTAKRLEEEFVKAFKTL